MGIRLTILLVVVLLIGCSEKDSLGRDEGQTEDDRVAYFAGGCFWCMESAFEEYDGVSEVVSGFMGGSEENPLYKDVSAGRTEHLETVKVFYDPGRIRYEDLLEIFWRQIDPTDAEGSFVDRGTQYRSAIFFQAEEFE